MAQHRRCEKEMLVIALVGNPNVGKSTLFNQLTGLNQSVGNWPGKTVEIAEGKLVFKGLQIKIVDLPGIYSLSSYSDEEVVTRDYLLSGSSHVVVNVIDASALERNLYLTLQLLELRIPLIVALNFMDDAKKKGVEIQALALSKELGVPVVQINAFSGAGLAELVEVATAQARAPPPKRVRYGGGVEVHLSRLSDAFRNGGFVLPPNLNPEWVAIKLIEGDQVLIERYPVPASLRSVACEVCRSIESIHGEPSGVVMASERYAAIHRIVSSSSKFYPTPVRTTYEKVESALTHPVLGYLVLLLVLAASFYSIFAIGGFLSTYVESLFLNLILWADGVLSASVTDPFISDLLLNGILFGMAAAISIIVSYISAFYLVMSILEDTGYLPRAAFLLDSIMHKVGLHGKAFIPLLLGFGCSVPACISCRIMETKKERFILGALVVLVPCSARSVIIFGMVAEYLGPLFAVGIYALDILVVLALGRFLFKVMPGESVGLIMEMPRLRLFKPLFVVKRTWIRTREFLFIGFPLIVVGSVVVESMRLLGLLDPFIDAISPFTSGLLGLPAVAGVALIFGILRKEMALVMLATYANSFDFASFMSPIQMVVFTTFMVFYVPCVATIAALVKEYGLKGTVFMVVISILTATAIATTVRLILCLFL
ncbi:MAG: ferrous iron transport protein B [Candidatus Verstraetearchaeota archaeon]|nr:ferrous iron transport protein B [Candidatus Verstraetearchaeota archaeon]